MRPQSQIYSSKEELSFILSMVSTTKGLTLREVLELCDMGNNKKGKAFVRKKTESPT